jgi:hypothetical protein
MKKKNHIREMNRDLLGLGKSSMIISSGSLLVGVPALQAPAGIRQSFPLAASFMPVGTLATMGKHTIGMIQDINKPRKKQRR